MMKLEINNIGFEIAKSELELLPQFEFLYFSIKPYYYGLFYNLKVFKKYIINTWGFITNTGSLPTPFSVPSTEILYFPKGTTDNNCYDVGSMPTTTGNYKCAPDFDPLFGSFKDDFSLYLKYTNGAVEGGSTSCKFKNGNLNTVSRENYCMNVCAGDGISLCSCVNQNENSQMIIKDSITGINYCKPFDYINFAKAEPITINNVVISSN